jgi:hypothetical protein
MAVNHKKNNEMDTAEADVQAGRNKPGVRFTVGNIIEAGVMS